MKLFKKNTKELVELDPEALMPTPESDSHIDRVITTVEGVIYALQMQESELTQLIKIKEEELRQVQISLKAMLSADTILKDYNIPQK